MAMREQQRNVYRTMQGKEIDMHKLAMQNEMAIAVGNARVNARGDELGPGGRIIRKREDIIREAQGSVPDEIIARPAAPAPKAAEASTVPPVIAPVEQKNIKLKKVNDMDPEGNE